MTTALTPPTTDETVGLVEVVLETVDIVAGETMMEDTTIKSKNF